MLCTTYTFVLLLKITLKVVYSPFFISASSSFGAAGVSTTLQAREHDNENGHAANSVESQNREQWPRVSLARCGIAKEFNGTADDFFVQQQQAGRNVFGDDGSKIGDLFLLFKINYF